MQRQHLVCANPRSTAQHRASHLTTAPHGLQFRGANGSGFPRRASKRLLLSGYDSLGYEDHHRRTRSRRQKSLFAPRQTSLTSYRLTQHPERLDNRQSLIRLIVLRSPARLEEVIAEKGLLPSSQVTVTRIARYRASIAHHVASPPITSCSRRMSIVRSGHTAAGGYDRSACFRPCARAMDHGEYQFNKTICISSRSQYHTSKYVRSPWRALCAQPIYQ